MSGKTDVRVRAHLAYTVNTYTSTGHTGTSVEIARGVTLDNANAIARGLFKAAGHPRDLTLLRAEQTTSTAATPWLTDIVAMLEDRPDGAELLIQLEPKTDFYPSRRVMLTWLTPEYAEKAAAPEGSAFSIETDSWTVASVVDTVKEAVVREISRINLPECWEDLSRETSKRGLIAFMAIQAAGKEVWRDHEIEALVATISKHTGKAKIDLRTLFERALEDVRKAKQQVEAGQIPLTSREEHYCKNRAKGVSPDQAARYAGYAHPHQASAVQLEAREAIQRRIAELSTPAAEGSFTITAPDPEAFRKATATAARKASRGSIDVPAVFQVGEKTWKVPADQMPPKGSLRLDNATQEFFALNVGFYGMTIEAAAKQMSLPLPTADGLMEMPTVRDRIKFFQRLLSPLA